MSKTSDSAPCAHLRTKKWFFLDAPPRSAAELMDASNHCWCAHTSSSLGRDGEVVDPDLCERSRACWTPGPGARVQA